MTTSAEELAERLEALCVRASAGPHTFAPQKGAPGKCMVAQVWNDAGDSVAQIEPSDSPDCANATAEFLALALDNFPTIAAALRQLSEEAGRIREALERIELGFDEYDIGERAAAMSNVARAALSKEKHGE